MSEERGEQQSPVEQAVEQALDLLLYAPLGLALRVRDEFPKLVEKGRQQMAGQMLLARMAGEFAVSQAQREFGRAMKKAGAWLHEVQEGSRLAAGPATTPATAPTPPPPAPAPAPEVAPEVISQPASSNGPPATGAINSVAENGGRPSTLAIPGYDLLSASQVVQRLEGLSEAELEEVRSHEASHRRRKTILTRISQLQGNA